MVLGFRGSFERGMAASGAIVGRGLAIGLAEGSRERVGAAVAGLFSNHPDLQVGVRKAIGSPQAAGFSPRMAT